MSNSEEQTTADLGINDEKLPEDLQPGEDNPLAGGLDDGETVDDLLEGGKKAETDGPTDGAATSTTGGGGADDGSGEDDS